MKKIFFIWFLFFFILFFKYPSKAIGVEFLCDDPNRVPVCDQTISNVECKSPPNYGGSCIGTQGSYYSVASCDAFDHADVGLYYFKRYYFRIKKDGAGNCGSPSWAYSHTWAQTGSTNTDVTLNICRGYAANAPAGCNTGFQPNSPTTLPTNIPASCPFPYNVPPIQCNNIPCAYKNGCGCSCTNPPCAPYQCSGGPPPTATPTPTPTPFCRLFCPGQEGTMGGMQVGGGGVQTLDFQPTPVQPTQAVGFLSYFGFNRFICGTFDDALTFPKLCPQGNTGGLENDQWTYPTPTTSPIRYNMLCGNQTHVYTAIVNAGARTGAYGIGQPDGPTPTAAPTPTLGIYPPGCYAGTPTPTPEGYIETVADQDAQFLKEQGGALGADANSCSCSVAVGCQTSLQSLPSATGVSCNANCDFTVSPETPEFGDAVTYTASGAGVNGNSTFNFDDNTAPVGASGGSVTHTFANSGVYRVSLSCNNGAQVCTRTVNNYCGPLSWYKIKNSSLHKNNAINNAIPASVTAFDADDTNQALTSIGNAGLVTSTGSITNGAGNLSVPNWKTPLYTRSTTYTPTTYADYLVARKTYTTFVDNNSNGVIDSNELTTNAINYVVGNYAIESNSVQSNAPIVIVVRGNLTINTTGTEFNPPDKAMTFIVTGTLNIHSHIETMNGIFIATNVDTAYDVSSSTTPLKFVGNLISQNSINLMKRVRTNGAQPSLFIVQDYKQYTRIMDKLGISKYTQTELRP